MVTYPCMCVHYRDWCILEMNVLAFLYFIIYAFSPSSLAEKWVCSNICVENHGQVV